MAIVTITKENFENEVMNSEKAVLLDFWAEWCGPCRMLSPIIDAIAEQRSDITVGKINVDNEMELANKFGIESIPTLVIVKGGEISARMVGYNSKAIVEGFIDKNI